ncbi:hypothetical protein GUJ93_ZPchr0003g17001 [Zizania palustris]|uniref:Uncharacterized protein n=1 Tax=Zizania palustris TaxID=103762 RepID=A0A8J5S966_ZIZPA|nr:hypothetical protein GUJ93_ZPchr0003g17001 [Zizania palustris]
MEDIASSVGHYSCKVEMEESVNVQDLEQILSRGAPKRLKSFQDNKRIRRCSQCKGTNHDKRNCQMKSDKRHITLQSFVCAADDESTPRSYARQGIREECRNTLLPLCALSAEGRTEGMPRQERSPMMNPRKKLCTEGETEGMPERERSPVTNPRKKLCAEGETEGMPEREEAGRGPSSVTNLP